MHIIISKDCTLQEVKALLKILNRPKKSLNTINAFFGKIPNIEDGLIDQNQLRREWLKKHS